MNWGDIHFHFTRLARRRADSKANRGDEWRTYCGTGHPSLRYSPEFLAAVPEPSRR